MGMPKGLKIATNYYNRIEARRDWDRLATEIMRAGYPEVVWRYTPPADAGYKKIDHCTKEMRKEFEKIKNKIHD